MNIIQWRGEGELSRFPFQEGLVPTTASGFILPDGFLVDAQIFIPGGLVGPAQLSSLSIAGNLISGVISAGTSPVATFQTNISSAPGPIPLVSPDGIARGTLVLGSQVAMTAAGLAVGVNLLNSGTAFFEGGCCFALPAAARSLSFGGQTYYGKVALAEGDGIKLVATPGNIRIDAVGSDSQKKNCCPDPSGVPLKSINQALPDKTGNIQFNLEPFGEPASLTDLIQILRIGTLPNGLVFYLSK